ncbi:MULTISPECIES: carbon storage regulator CsrA [unclassified Paenibacillus]|uniref:carbon storage regulator CsrA n=1 Tax=unclassified Paenibacillus TaxID=185978 RepID=UPI0011451A04|nr:carbon storage regulator CsrA [Paenibacillus sp. tmac-D7]
MLVLSRKPGESIMIGDNIELVVLGTEGDVVKIGIVAPKHQPILRKEIYTAVKDSNTQALNSTINLKHLKTMIEEKNNKKL